MMVNRESEGSRSERGFAAMDPNKQREIASKGGKTAHQRGTAHQFTSEEAREAGRKGGQRVSSNREHMASIGRKGGQSSSNRRARDASDEGEGENVAFRDDKSEPVRQGAAYR